jgi:glutamyl-tRNA reductase
LKEDLTGNIGMCEFGFNELNEALQIMDVIIYSMEIYGSDAGNIIDLNVLEKNIKASKKIMDENNNPKEKNKHEMDRSNYFYIDLDNIKKISKKKEGETSVHTAIKNLKKGILHNESDT